MVIGNSSIASWEKNRCLRQKFLVHTVLRLRCQSKQRLTCFFCYFCLFLMFPPNIGSYRYLCNSYTVTAYDIHIYSYEFEHSKHIRWMETKVSLW